MRAALLMHAAPPTRSILPLCALLLYALLPTAVATAAPPVGCPGSLPAKWLDQGAVTHQQCALSLLAADGFKSETALDPLGAQPLGDGLLGAWNGNALLGLSVWHPNGPPPTANDGLLDLAAATISDTGHAGAEGELWWGRVSRGEFRCCTRGSAPPRRVNGSTLQAVNDSESLLLAVGQESSVRRAQAIASASELRQFNAGQLGPWPVGATRLHYTQLAATSVLSLGSAPVPPGTLADATLDLAVPEQLSGRLQFTLSIAGRSAPLSIALKRDVDEAAVTLPNFGLPGHPYRLRASKPDAALRYARGMFFGSNGEYLVIVFQALPPDPNGGPTLWGEFRGLVVLRRVSAL